MPLPPNIGVSVAQLFPDLSLTGQFGIRNTDSDYLTHWSSHFYSYGLQVSIPIFQGGRLMSNARLARTQQANAVLTYRQTVLTALQDVENALVSYRADQQRVDGLEQTADAPQNAFNLASNSYRQGISTFIEVLDAQRQLPRRGSRAHAPAYNPAWTWSRCIKRCAAAVSSIRREICLSFRYLARPKR